MFDVGLIGDKANYSKTPDVYSFDEDSSDTLSPEQPSNQETPSSTLASRESGGTEATSSSTQLNSPIQVNQYPQPLQFLKHKLSTENLAFSTNFLI